MLTFDYRGVAWSDNPIDAADHFYRERVAEIRATLDPASPFWSGMSPGASTLDCATIVFPPAAHAHRAWRLAVVQDLARELAPRRINAVVGTGDDAIQEAIDYLADAPGVTGQLLEVDGNSPASGYIEGR